MKMVQIKSAVFDCTNGNPYTLYEAGKTYPANEDAQRQVALGNGTEVEAAEEVAAPAEPPAHAEPEATAPAASGKSKRAA